MKAWLDKYRRKINKIDKKIIKLLAKRGVAAVKIAGIKYQTGSQVYDRLREKDLLERLFKLNIAYHSPFNNIAIQNIYKTILKESRLLQSKNIHLDNYQPDQIKISVQGIQGSFSEQVGLNYCEEKLLKNYTIDYAISSEQVIIDILNNKSDLGVVALCNNWGGVVDETVTALKGHPYHVIDTYKLMVKQNLLILPGTKKDKIKDIYSHQQALAQCRDYLQINFPMANLHEVEDTAQAANKLSKGDYGSNAAVIASELCAKYYNLDIYGKAIQDNLCNETLFLIIAKK